MEDTDSSDDETDKESEDKKEEALSVTADEETTITEIKTTDIFTVTKKPGTGKI